MDSVAARIFSLADEKFKEQKDFANAIEKTPSMVSQWRMGITKSYQKHLPQIAKALGTTTEYLLTGSKPEPMDAGTLSAEDKEILRQIHDRPGMRVMFSLTSKATDEDVEKAAKIIEAYLGKPEG